MRGPVGAAGVSVPALVREADVGDATAPGEVRICGCVQGLDKGSMPCKLLEHVKRDTMKMVRGCLVLRQTEHADVPTYIPGTQRYSDLGSADTYAGCVEVIHIARPHGHTYRLNVWREDVDPVAPRSSESRLFTLLVYSVDHLEHQFCALHRFCVLMHQRAETTLQVDRRNVPYLRVSRTRCWRCLASL